MTTKRALANLGGMERCFSLPREIRLSKDTDFKRILKTGERLSSRFLGAVVMENGLPYQRLGIRVGSKFGKSVRRNRAKRLIREAFRLNRYKLPEGIDIIFFATSAWGEPTLQEVVESMMELFAEWEKP